MTFGTRVRLHPDLAPKLEGAEATVVAVIVGPLGDPYYLVKLAKGKYRAFPHELEELPSFSSLNGFSGDMCVKCQSVRMVRIGSCLRCEDCGETTGC